MDKGVEAYGPHEHDAISKWNTDKTVRREQFYLTGLTARSGGGGQSARCHGPCAIPTSDKNLVKQEPRNWT